ncbi:MAG: tricarballylate utilization 4Fe-4S protein TcuB [Rhizobiaceae bacterium]
MSIETISTPAITEARRQIDICNACRYCEGYCSAFPAITRLRQFSDSDISQIANLCHNCRGCYYACQYTTPHEFDLNLPRALAEVRNESWQDFIWPRGIVRLFQKQAWATVLATVLGFAAIFALMRSIGSSSNGIGFYAVLSHTVMVAIFLPAFLLPVFSIGLGLRSYWRDLGGQRIKMAHLVDAFAQAASMRNLAGGHGDGCNFEQEERYSGARKHAHHAVMYGFLLCFASTSVATLLHYVFDMPAPYPLLSAPKILGLVGGVMLTCGCVWMLALRRHAEAKLSDPSVRSAETAFIVLLGFVAATGLALYALGSTVWMPALLAIHLGSVLSFFLLTPYTKMAHGFFRLAALVRDAQQRDG